MLSALTDEELRRYGEIAADQRRLEWRYGWAQIVCLAGALAATVWFVRELLTAGISWRAGAGLGLAALLGYWPYRKAIVRRLWTKHCRAVERETEMRRNRRDE